MADGVPAALDLVESFLNSVDDETGADDMADAASYRRWLGEHDQPDEPDGPDAEAGRALAREVRDELRAEVATHHDGGGRDRARLSALAARVGLAARFGPDGAVTLAPAGAGGTAVLLGRVLAAVTLAAHDGSWRRLKICPADDCHWVYYDLSRNGSRRWCSMSGCGNRNKTRAYRSRANTTQ